MPVQPPPDEEQLEALLRGLRPRPGARFYRRTESAPWRGQPSFWSRRRLTTLGLALLVVLAIGALTSPGIYALGEQLWRFFVPEQGNRLVIPLDTPGVVVSRDLSSTQDFPLGRQEAQDQAGFLAKMLPEGEGLALAGMRYEPLTGAIRSLYQAEHLNLYLTQRPLQGIREHASVGPAAAIESVSVGGQPAEYVSGGWRMPAVSTEGDNQLDLTWDVALPQRTLRWQDAGFAYELRAVGVDAPQKQALIALAERVK